jgi:hypothetical protein
VAGVPPLIMGIVALIDLLYQFWVHTELVASWAGSTAVFCSPSNHRVHHAVNDRYLDRNYGGILILWDRLFGSFREEDETLRLRHPGRPAQLGPAVGQCRGLCGAAARQLAHPALGRQVAGLVQAARLAAGRSGP